MKEVIILSEFISEELRSGTEAEKIYLKVKSIQSPSITIDFLHISFMSRTFTDEFCHILDLLHREGKKIDIINKQDYIDVILKILYPIIWLRFKISLHMRI